MAPPSFDLRSNTHFTPFQNKIIEKRSRMAEEKKSQELPLFFFPIAGVESEACFVSFLFFF